LLKQYNKDNIVFKELSFSIETDTINLSQNVIIKYF